MLIGEEKRAYQRAWLAARRATWFEDKKCVKCGSTDSLELHHIDPKTKVSHRVWSWAQARSEKELAKCEVLCHECHLPESIEHWKEMYSTPLSKKKHGTSTTYTRHGCRCILCKTWRSSKYKRLGTQFLQYALGNKPNFTATFREWNKTHSD